MNTIQDASNNSVLNEALQHANSNISHRSSEQRQNNRDLIIKLSAIQSAIDDVCLFHEKLSDGDYLTLSNNLKALMDYFKTLQTSFTTLMDTPIVQAAIGSVGRRDKRLVDIQTLLKNNHARPCPCCNRIVMNNKAALRSHMNRDVCKIATDMIRKVKLIGNKRMRISKENFHKFRVAHYILKEHYNQKDGEIIQKLRKVGENFLKQNNRIIQYEKINKKWVQV